MPSAPENTFCWKSFPSPEEEECMTDLWTCKSADLSFLHGLPHRVTATMAASHYHDPRSTSRSSHYCSVHQNVHINVLPLSYLAVCRRRMVGVWASAESLFVCLHCWLGVITPSLILVVIQLCVFSAVGTKCEVWGSLFQGAWLAEAVRVIPLCCHSLHSHCLCLKHTDIIWDGEVKAKTAGWRCRNSVPASPGQMFLKRYAHAAKCYLPDLERLRLWELVRLITPAVTVIDVPLKRANW